MKINKWFVILALYIVILVGLPFIDSNNIFYQTNLIGAFPVLAMGLFFITCKCLGWLPEKRK